MLPSMTLCRCCAVERRASEGGKGASLPVRREPSRSGVQLPLRPETEGRSKDHERRRAWAILHPSSRSRQMLGEMEVELLIDLHHPLNFLQVPCARNGLAWAVVVDNVIDQSGSCLDVDFRFFDARHSRLLFHILPLLYSWPVDISTHLSLQDWCLVLIARLNSRPHPAPMDARRRPVLRK
jgi:hypothetical protein